MVRTWKSPRILLGLLGKAKATQVISKFSQKKKGGQRNSRNSIKFNNFSRWLVCDNLHLRAHLPLLPLLLLLLLLRFPPSLLD